MSIHSPGLPLIIIPPAFHQKLLPAENHILVPHQAEQQGKLLRGKGYLLSSRKDPLGGKLQRNLSCGKTITCQDTSPTAVDERRQLGIEHRQRKRLCDIVIRSQFITQKLILFIGKRRQENDRNITLLSQRPAYRQSIQLRYHDIQQHTVKILLLSKPKSLQPILCRHRGFSPSGKIVAENGTKPWFVLCDQDP